MTDIVLVTGASGFVGAAVARALVEEGARVRVLLRPQSDRRNIAGLPVEIAQGALEDRDSLLRALAGCRALYHVAADYRLWVPDEAPMYRANVEGTRQLMEAAMAAKLERVVYTSSVATLGYNADGSPADEETPSSLDDMIGPYKRSKFLAEEEVRKLIPAGLPAVIVNPSGPVGPRDIKPTPTGRMIIDAASGRTPAYVDTGLNIVHVSDVARGHLLAAARGRIGERYILGGDNMGLGQLFATIAEIAGKRPPLLRLPLAAVWPVAIGAETFARLSGREPMVTRDALRMARHKMFFASAKAIRELGYAPRPARDGLADAIAWFRDNGYCR